MSGAAATNPAPVVPGALAAARFAADGEVAGCKPGTATGGEACADGSCGESVELATAAVPAAAASDFHQAQRGAVWHPDIAANKAATVNAWVVDVFMSATGSKLAGTSL